MKKLLILIFIFLGFEFAHSTSKNIFELKIKELFVIEKGFDTNDDIEFSFYTQLPSSCFRPYKKEITRDGNNITLKLLIKRRNLTGCGFENSGTEFPINYSDTIRIGELKSGKYNVRFLTENTTVSKSFYVKPSTSNNLDENNYAPISSAFIPELIQPTNHAHVILTGIYNNTCERLTDSNIEIIKQNNVFIVLPKIKASYSQSCFNDQSALQNIVNLGPILREGHYMIHIRSQSGLSVNKIFHVKKPIFEPRGN